MNDLFALALILVLLLCSLGTHVTHAQVKQHQKINATQGGFTGVLEVFDFFGSAVASLGDVDGDGVTDLAVGAPFDNDGAGAVWVLFLNRDGTVKSMPQPQKISADPGGPLEGELEALDFFGSSIANLGDIGTGSETAVTAIAVGAPFDNGIGAIWVLFLNEDGTVESHRKISAAPGGPLEGELEGGDFFGFSVAKLSDLNDDGVTDLAVGAPGDDDGGVFGSVSDLGAVWVLFLNEDGTVQTHQKISAVQGGFIGGLDLGDFFGLSVASLDDLDNDGVTDLSVGAPFDDDYKSDAGAVWVLYLNRDGTVKATPQPQKISTTRSGFSGELDAADFFGLSLTNLGDLSGDGVTVLAVGAPGDDAGESDAGAMWMLFLSREGTNEDLVKDQHKIGTASGGFTGELKAGDNFGLSIATLGDLDGGGVTDIAAAVGATGDDDGETSAGAVWVLFLKGEPETTVAGLFNTGVDDTGTVLPPGSPDPHYRLIQQPPSAGTTAIVTEPNERWIAPPPGSAWIAPSPASQSDPVGDYLYTLTFDLAGLDPASVIITGDVSSDNSLAVLLNGTGTGIILPEDQFLRLEPFRIEAGFRPGRNTLEFQVTNAVPTNGNPTGLLVASLRGEAEADPMPPLCELVEPVEGVHLTVRLQDSGSGLDDIMVLRDDNAAVMEEAFTPGTTEPVIVTATKIDPAMKSVVALRITDRAGNKTECDPVLTTLLAEVPEQFRLEQNYPNPFNPTTTIRFQLTEQAHVVLEIYDVLGRKVTTLIDQAMQPGTYAAEWDGKNDVGMAVAGGTYVYRIRAGSFTETKAMILLK